MTLDATRFEKLAADTLNDLFDLLDDAVGDGADVDMENEILTVELESGARFLINKHGPNREIWLSSPVSGASHYGYDADGGRWTDTRDGTDLMARLAADLSQATGEAVIFE